MCILFATKLTSTHKYKLCILLCATEGGRFWQTGHDREYRGQCEWDGWGKCCSTLVCLSVINSLHYFVVMLWYVTLELQTIIDYHRLISWQNAVGDVTKGSVTTPNKQVSMFLGISVVAVTQSTEWRGECLLDTGIDIKWYRTVIYMRSLPF